MISNIPLKFKEIVKLITGGHTLPGDTFYEILSSFASVSAGVQGETVNEILYKMLQTSGVPVKLNDTTYNYLCQLVYLLSEHHILNDNITSKYIILDELYEALAFDSNPLNFTANEANSTVSLEKLGTLETSYEYSTDNVTWNPYNIGDTITLVNVGDKVYFRGDNKDVVFSVLNHMKFTILGSVAGDGNIMSILDPTMQLDTVSTYCFNSLFNSCYGLTQAPKLPAINLSPSCYNYMFQNCYGLTEAPELPATTLASRCYALMFQNCTNLTVVPALPATTINTRAYMAMFRGCSALNSLTVYINELAPSPAANWLVDTASGTTGVIRSLGTISDSDLRTILPSNWSISH